MRNKKIKFDSSNQTEYDTNIVSDKFIQKVVSQLKKVRGVRAILLCGSRARKTNNQKSDYDLFVLNDWDNSYFQVIHSKIQGKSVDFLLFPVNQFKTPNKQLKRTIAGLLEKFIILYAEDDISRLLQKEFVFNISSLSNEYELESIWHFIRANIDKTQNTKTDPEFANILIEEAYYLVGLFYARLNSEEIYGFSHSLKYMQRTNPTFWKQYISFHKKTDKVKFLEQLIACLPTHEFMQKESLVELDSFISMASFYHVDLYKKPRFKKDLDQLIHSLNKPHD